MTFCVDEYVIRVAIELVCLNAGAWFVDASLLAVSVRLLKFYV